MSKLSIKRAAAEFDTLTEVERRALRVSRFHALPAVATSSSHESRPRLAHPGGPLATNKAAALAKFLKRKLNEPGGAASLDPALVEKAVDSAKATAHAGKGPAAAHKNVRVRHVDSFSDSDEEEANHKGDMLQEQVRVGKKCKQKHSKKMADFREGDHNARSKKIKQKKKPKKSLVRI